MTLSTLQESARSWNLLLKPEVCVFEIDICHVLMVGEEEKKEKKGRRG